MKNNSNNKLVMDFTQNTPQEVALMPLALSQKLLKDYAEKLSSTHVNQILLELKEDIQHIRNSESSANNMQKAIQLCQDFVNERTLIENIMKNNWDAYKVCTEEQAAEIQNAITPVN